MKKSTILILCIVFVGSVLVVGLFGMRSVPVEERIPIEEIYFTSITTNLKDAQFQGDLIDKVTENEKGEKEIYLPFEEGMTVFVGYAFNPADATEKKVDIQILYNNSYDYTNPEYFEVDDRFVITFKNIAHDDLCSIRLEYHATDQAAGGAASYLWINIFGSDYRDLL